MLWSIKASKKKMNFKTSNTFSSDSAKYAVSVYRLRAAGRVGNRPGVASVSAGSSDAHQPTLTVPVSRSCQQIQREEEEEEVSSSPSFSFESRTWREKQQVGFRGKNKKKTN